MQRQALGALLQLQTALGHSQSKLAFTQALSSAAHAHFSTKSTQEPASQPSGHLQSSNSIPTCSGLLQQRRGPLGLMLGRHALAMGQVRTMAGGPAEDNTTPVNTWATFRAEEGVLKRNDMSQAMYMVIMLFAGVILTQDALLYPPRVATMLAITFGESKYSAQ